MLIRIGDLVVDSAVNKASTIKLRVIYYKAVNSLDDPAVNKVNHLKLRVYSLYSSLFI